MKFTHAHIWSYIEYAVSPKMPCSLCDSHPTLRFFSRGEGAVIQALLQVIKTNSRFFFRTKSSTIVSLQSTSSEYLTLNSEPHEVSSLTLDVANLQRLIEGKLNGNECYGTLLMNSTDTSKRKDAASMLQLP